MPAATDDDPRAEMVALADHLRFCVTRLARLLRSADEGDLTPSLGASLASIVNHGPLTLGGLAAREQMAPATVTKVVDKLEAKGLVARRAGTEDRRVTYVEATARGRRHIEANRGRRTAWLAERLAALPEAEREQLAAALSALEALTAAPAGPAQP